MINSASKSKNTSGTNKKMETPTSPRINSKIKQLFYKNIIKRSISKIYTYGNLNLRKRNITRLTAEY
jgi:hypothetical protein